jgi:hypothetical protein
MTKWHFSVRRDFFRDLFVVVERSLLIFLINVKVSLAAEDFSPLNFTKVADALICVRKFAGYAVAVFFVGLVVGEVLFVFGDNGFFFIVGIS